MHIYKNQMCTHYLPMICLSYNLIHPDPRCQIFSCVTGDINGLSLSLKKAFPEINNKDFRWKLSWDCNFEIPNCILNSYLNIILHTCNVLFLVTFSPSTVLTTKLWVCLMSSLILVSRLVLCFTHTCLFIADWGDDNGTWG